MQITDEQINKILAPSSEILECYDIAFYTYWYSLVNYLILTQSHDKLACLKCRILGVGVPYQPYIVNDASHLCRFDKSTKTVRFLESDITMNLWWEVESKFDGSIYYFDESFIACPDGTVLQVLQGVEQ